MRVSVPPSTRRGARRGFKRWKAAWHRASERDRNAYAVAAPSLVAIPEPGEGCHARDGGAAPDPAGVGLLAWCATLPGLAAVARSRRRPPEPASPPLVLRGPVRHRPPSAVARRCCSCWPGRRCAGRGPGSGVAGAGRRDDRRGAGRWPRSRACVERFGEAFRRYQQRRAVPVARASSEVRTRMDRRLEVGHRRRPGGRRGGAALLPHRAHRRAQADRSPVTLADREAEQRAVAVLRARISRARHARRGVRRAGRARTRAGSSIRSTAPRASSAAFRSSPR